MKKTAYIIYILAAIVAAAVINITDILPAKLVLVFEAAVVVSAIIAGILMFRKKAGKKSSIAGIVISFVMAAVLIAGSVFAGQASSFFGAIADNGKDVVKYAVISRNDDSIKGPENINGGKVNVTLETAQEYLTAQGTLKEKLAEENCSFDFEYSENNKSILKELVAKKIDFAFINEGSYNVICDDNEKYKKGTKVIYEVEVERIKENASKGVDVTKKPFNMYITGLDTTGTIDVVSRSDVNMVATINPVTKMVLLTSIPRDYYINLHTHQQMDKLTHTGIYGADETVKTVEDLLGIDINYYYKCNFTTVVSLVDAIGGIDVESDYEFSTHGRQNEGFYFVKGTNHLDGKSALAFARERKSFSGGDRQRIKDQQIVLEAVLKKVTKSDTLLTKYSSILKSIEPYIETSMSDSEIKALVKMQMNDMADWKIMKISLDGAGDSAPCYSAGNVNASVIRQDENSIQEAKAAIAEVTAGREPVLKKKKSKEKEKK